MTHVVAFAAALRVQTGATPRSSVSAPSLASVASRFPTTLRLPPYAGTATYRFASRVRFRTLLESGGKLFAITTAPSGGRALLLVLRGAALAIVPLSGGPYVSLAVREETPAAAVLAGLTSGAKPVVRHLLLARGRVVPTTRTGDGLQVPPASGQRCLDSRTSSPDDGAALVLMDGATGALRPSIAKSTLRTATGGASQDLSLTLRCHGFGPDTIVWLGDTTPTPAIARPAGISLFAGAHVRPLLGVAPVAVSEHYLLFEQGDASTSETTLSYTLVRTS